MCSPEGSRAPPSRGSILVERAWEPWVTMLPLYPFSPAPTPPPHPSLNRKRVQLCQPGGPALEGPPLLAWVSVDRTMSDHAFFTRLAGAL